MAIKYIKMNVIKQNLIKNKLQDSKVLHNLSPDNFLDAVVMLMGLAEKSNLEGNEKKQLVSELIGWAVINCPNLNAEEKENMLIMADSILPGIIDFIIFVARNKKILRQFKKNCSCLF